MNRIPARIVTAIAMASLVLMSWNTLVVADEVIVTTNVGSGQEPGNRQLEVRDSTGTQKLEDMALAPGAMRAFTTVVTDDLKEIDQGFVVQATMNDLYEAQSDGTLDLALLTVANWGTYFDSGRIASAAVEARQPLGAANTLADLLTAPAAAVQSLLEGTCTQAAVDELLDTLTVGSITNTLNSLIDDIVGGLLGSTDSLTEAEVLAVICGALAETASGVTVPLDALLETVLDGVGIDDLPLVAVKGGSGPFTVPECTAGIGALAPAGDCDDAGGTTPVVLMESGPLVPSAISELLGSLPLVGADALFETVDEARWWLESLGGDAEKLAHDVIGPLNEAQQLEIITSLFDALPDLSELSDIRLSATHLNAPRLRLDGDLGGAPSGTYLGTLVVTIIDGL